MKQIQRADWVTCQGSRVVGTVKRVARDGSWADVNWHSHTKRMPTTISRERRRFAGNSRRSVSACRTLAGWCGPSGSVDGRRIWSASLAGL